MIPPMKQITEQEQQQREARAECCIKRSVALRAIANAAEALAPPPPRNMDADSLICETDVIIQEVLIACEAFRVAHQANEMAKLIPEQEDLSTAVDIETAKMIEFFRSKEGSHWAEMGDAFDYSPARCAIEAIQQLTHENARLESQIKRSGYVESNQECAINDILRRLQAVESQLANDGK